MAWVVGGHEQARLTPEGPTAAVIESAGALPLRVRGGMRLAHPGTAVSLGRTTFEVVGEERIGRTCVYRLEPWHADHIARDRVDYGPAFVRAAARERSRTRLQRLPGAGLVARALEMVAALLPGPARAAFCARYDLDAVRGTRMAALVGVAGAGIAWGFCLIAAMREQLDASAGELRDFSHVTATPTAHASPLYFVLGPLGLLLEYVLLTSAVRLVHVGLNGEPLADPLLALLAWTLRLTTSQERRRRARRGPPRPDRVSTSGERLVVLCASEKPEWDEQATIQVGERFYRLAAVEDQPDGAWTALAYVLEPVAPGAVFRKLVRWEPAGSAAPTAAPTAATPAPASVASAPPAPAAPKDRGDGVRPAKAADRGSRFYVDAGEEARLTPEGPGAAVIESLGCLPLRVRSESGGIHHRPVFPGTAVVLGGARFEVVAEETLETGVRYHLDPWPHDHILRDMVEYSPRLVRAAQRERAQAVEVERARRWSWLLYPFVGLLPEPRQLMVCERLGLDAALATLAGALFEALVLFTIMTGGGGSPLEAMRRHEGLGFRWVNEAGILMSTILIRALGALAFDEVAGSAVLGFAFEVAQALEPFAARFDAMVVPLTREAFWARLGVPDRHEPQPDGSIVVRSLLPHLTWGTSAGSARIPAGRDWWSVAVLPPLLERGRLTWRYQLFPLGDPKLGAPEPPGVRQYQQEVVAAVEREWDGFLLAFSWLACLFPEDVQQRAYGHRGGPPAARRATLVTACVELFACVVFLPAPTPLTLATAALLAFDGGRRITRALHGRYGSSLVGGLVSDYVRSERRAYHAHLDAERAARSARRSV